MCGAVSSQLERGRAYGISKNWLWIQYVLWVNEKWRNSNLRGTFAASKDFSRRQERPARAPNKRATSRHPHSRSALITLATITKDQWGRLPLRSVHTPSPTTTAPTHTGSAVDSSYPERLPINPHHSKTHAASTPSQNGQVVFSQPSTLSGISALWCATRANNPKAAMAMRSATKAVKTVLLRAGSVLAEVVITSL